MVFTDVVVVDQGVMWGLASFLEKSREANGHVVLVGAPASPGRHTGPVRVVMGEHQFSKIRAGDVGVCPVTSPSYSVVFPQHGGAHDRGGIFSHPAIIAGERGYRR